MSAIVNREEFDHAIAENFTLKSKSNRCMWNRDDVKRAISILLEIQAGIKKTSVHYHYEKLYKLVTVDNVHYVCKRDAKSLVYVIPYEDYFDKLYEAHTETGHGGRDRVRTYCKDKWIIAKEACQLFVSMCRTCNLKRVMPTKGVVIKPILSDGFNSRGQVDLIDFQSCADGKKLF